MKSNYLQTAVSKLLAAVSVMLIVILVLASGAGAASEFKVLHTFTWASSPQGTLIFDAAGNLYGTTSGGGAYGNGTVFKLVPNMNGSWTASVLHSFTRADGANPIAGLILDGSGNLYGTTEYGGACGICGVVFKLKPNPDGTWTESVLHNFTGEDGSHPTAGLIFDAAGNLYGTTTVDGSDFGVVFKLTPNPDGTWEEKVLHMFCCYIWGGVILDASGNLYGTTANGQVSAGTVFELSPNSDGNWTASTLLEFPGQAYPADGLIFDGSGNLYGTTQQGGVGCTYYGCGVVFKLKPNPDGTWTESVLHNFTGADGASPYAGLIFDTAGNLYGTTYLGGCAGKGVVYKLTPTSSGWKETVLHDFTGYGANPYGGLIMDAAGNLFGTASSGSGNGGLVFEITP